MTGYVNPNADLLPDYPPEPPAWTVVASTGGGVRTFHTRTAADWVDTSGIRREWSEVCDLDENRRPQLRGVPFVEAPPETSDGFHSFTELYEFRMVWHAAFVNLLEDKLNDTTVKSKRHSDGEPCFGGGWFIVVTNLPGIGQVSNHYEDRFWPLFRVPEVEDAPVFDGHSSTDVLERLHQLLVS